MQAPFQDNLQIDVRGGSTLRSVGGFSASADGLSASGRCSFLVETTLGEIKSNDDVPGACFQLCLALATAEQVLLVLASPRSDTPASSPLPSPTTAVVTDTSQATSGAGVAASAAPLSGLDYLLVGLIFAAKAAATRAPGRGLLLSSLVCFVAPGKVHVSLAG